MKTGFSNVNENISLKVLNLTRSTWVLKGVDFTDDFKLAQKFQVLVKKIQFFFVCCSPFIL